MQTRILVVRNCLLAFFAIALMILSAFGPTVPEAHAATKAQAPNQVDPASDSPGLNDVQELEAFLDSLITPQLSEEHVAGATIAIVKDGGLFFTKGYGYADVEDEIPVDPETTLFRVGSIGKLFTWTAVMQLVEQGQLDLDTDVNQYLDFSIPATFSEPVTLKHLMTHTAGFEDTAFGFAATRAEDLVPLGTWLADNIPARAWAPGQVAAYSNYGAALAGYIVERVSGMPYADYVEQHILSPLGMTRSTPRQPVPAGLAPDLSHGYAYLNDAFQPQGFEYLNMVPAGGLSATATDMARFMIAHLQMGRYCELDCADSEIRILKEFTAQQMQSRLWTADEHLNGMAHGFMELSQNGTRVVGHPGDTPLFHSVLALLPEQNVGVFFSYNTRVYGLATPLLESFMDHYYPAHATEPPALPLEPAESTERFAAQYQFVRYAYSKGGKLKFLFESFPVQAGRAGELIIDFGDGPKQFVQVTPLYFEAVDDDLRLVFREDAAGNIAYLFMTGYPEMTFRKVAWYETMNFNLGLLAGCAVLFLLVLLVEPLRLLVGWLRRRQQLPQPGQARLARAVMAALAILALGMMFGLYWQIVENAAAIPMGERSVLSVLGGISILVVALAIGTAASTVLAWRSGWWGVIARIYHSLVALAAIAFVWFLAFWNQIGWQWW
jgi:CubicO group peptidase (beta-lactamase class C family)